MECLGAVYPTFTPGKKPITSVKTEGKGPELERAPVVSKDEVKRRLAEGAAQPP